METIVNDAGLIAGFDAANLPDGYYAVPTAVQGYIAGEGSLMEFDAASNTGFFGEAVGGGTPVAVTFDYAFVDGRLEADFSGDPIQVASVFGSSAEGTYACENPEYDAILPAGCHCADYVAAFANSPDGATNAVWNITNMDFTRIAVIGATEIASKRISITRTYDPLPQNGGAPDFQLCDEIEVSIEEVGLRNSDEFASVAYNSITLTDTAVAGTLFYDNGFGRLADNPRLILTDIVTYSSAQETCAAGWSRADTLHASQIADNSFDLCWRVVTPGSETSLEVSPGVFRQISRSGDLELDYGDGWLQVSRKLDANGPESGVAQDFWNTGSGERFFEYTRSVDVDPGFAFTEALLTNQPGEFWNSFINAWHPSQFGENENGDLVLIGAFGWELFANLTGENVFTDWSRPIFFWQVTTSPQSFGSSRYYPVGTLQMHFSNPANQRSRIWIPLAMTTAIEPEFIGGSVPRTRLYVLEEDIWAVLWPAPVATGTLFGPRINIEENISRSLSSAPPVSP